MNILIELPTWLGDAVMTTPAIENIIKKYPDAKLTLFGSYVSTQALKAHPNVIATKIDNSRENGFRLYNLLKISKELGKFDIFFSFRKTLNSKLFKYMINAPKKYQYKRYTKQIMHQSIHYNKFIQKCLQTNFETNQLKLYYPKTKYNRPTLGINPGATYGSAKRWFPDRFAKVATKLNKEYDIVIFGGPNEVDMANDIEKELQLQKITNYKNMAGKTTIPELLSFIGGLDLFITNDSGPMHVAAAYQVPSITIFGPTKHTETSQWKNPKSIIIRHNLKCSPCMKRTCPLKTDECMKLITVNEVLEAVKRL